MHRLSIVCTHVGIALAAVSLAGCGTRSPGSGTPAPRPGGSFPVIYRNEPETLDPQAISFLPEWEVASLSYEGLVGYGPEPGVIAPLLAERWEQSDGGRLWTFHLRDGVYFHDDPCFPGGRGRLFTARDVVDTLERIARPKAAWANWYLFAGKIDGIDAFHAGSAASIQGVAAPDPRRVQVRLTRPYAAFLPTLASHMAYIVPREAVELYGAELRRHPVGTGPFRLARWKPLDQISLVRHGRYWRVDRRGFRLPYLDGVDIRIRTDIPEPSMFTELLRGETGLIAVQQKLYDSWRQDPRQAERFQLVGELPQSSVRFFGFSLDTGTVLARNAELRRAFAMAFDRSRLARLSPEVRVLLADTLVPPYFLGRTPGWHPYDPRQARAVLDAHRPELARRPPVLASNFASGDLSLLREDLARLSVEVREHIRPAGYYQYIVKERPALFRVSFTPSLHDPEDYYCLFQSASSRDVNLTGYSNPEYDRILDAAKGEMDPLRRQALFLKLESILLRDTPAIYLSHAAPTYLVAAPHVRGVGIRFVLADLTEAWLEERNGPSREAQSAR